MSDASDENTMPRRAQAPRAAASEIRPAEIGPTAREQELRNLLDEFGALGVSLERAGCWALVAFALGMLLMTAIHFAAATPPR